MVDVLKIAADRREYMGKSPPIQSCSAGFSPEPLNQTSSTDEAATQTRILVADGNYSTQLVSRIHDRDALFRENPQFFVEFR